MDMVWKALFAIALSCTACQAAASHSHGSANRQQGAPLKEKMPWYHSTQEIHDEVTQIANSCSGAQVEFTTKTKINSGDAAGTEIAIDVVKVRKAGSAART